MVANPVQGDASPGEPDQRPANVAVVVVALQALALFGFGCWLAVELLISTPQNVGVARGSALFFIVSGVLVAGLARQLRARAGWSHGPAVFLQVLSLPVAWNMAQAQFWVGMVILGGGAVTALVALVSPPGRAAFGR